MNTPTVNIAKAALIEAGRPDLAAHVIPQAHGPFARLSAKHTELNLSVADRQLIAKAFLMAHMYHHPDAFLQGDGLGFWCEECWERLAATQSNIGPFPGRHHR